MGVGTGIWEQDSEYRNGNAKPAAGPGIREWEESMGYGTGNMGSATTENMGQRKGRRLGWEQDGVGSGVTQERAGGKGSDRGERGILDRGHQELGQGDMGRVPGQEVLNQLPQNLHQSLPEQPEPLSLGSPKP